MSTWDRELPPGDRSEAPKRPWVDVSATGHVPFPNALDSIARVKAICRQRYLAGEKQYAYPGIVDDLKAEQAELEGSARVPGEEG